MELLIPGYLLLLLFGEGPSEGVVLDCSEILNGRFFFAFGTRRGRGGVSRYGIPVANKGLI